MHKGPSGTKINGPRRTKSITNGIQVQKSPSGTKINGPSRTKIKGSSGTKIKGPTGIKSITNWHLSAKRFQQN